jgi:hypothetical protein
VTVGGVASNGVTFTVTTTSTAPVISNLNPTSGAVGTSVTITGSNFGASQGTSTVTFNGTAATPSSWSATSIIAPVPSGATTGPVVVRVGGVASNGVTFTVTVGNDLVIAYAFEEGIGTTTQDWSGNGDHGTLINGPSFVAGQMGLGLSFDGSNDYVETGNTANLSTWTVSGWVISPAAPANAAPSGPIHRNLNYAIGWNHNNAVFRGAASVRVGGTFHAASFGALAANTWHYLAATYDGETLRAYRDGVLITSNTAPSGPADGDPNSLRLGRHTATSSFFRGTVDEVRVYNRALSESEIQSDMMTPVAPPP